MAGLALIALLVSEWRRRGRRPAGAAWSVLVYDFAFVFLAFDNLPRLLTGTPWSALLLGGLFAWRLAVGQAADLYTPSPFSWRLVGRWALAELVFAAGVLGLCLRLPGGLAPLQIEHALVARAVLLLALAGWAGRVQPRLRPEREVYYGLLLFLGLVLCHPWFSPYLAGTGDAKLYQETLQDFLLQQQAGIFSPWVSQSETAPFGAVFPFRFATYHYYFAAALQFLTGGKLTLYALQHLTVILSVVLGGWTMYWSLQAVCPRRPALTCALAACYLASPAWLGPLYSLTMFFTIMALPFVPLALAGAWPEIGARSLGRAVLHGAALAAVWHSHIPVGFWVCASVACCQAIAAVVLRPGWKVLARQLTAWSVCVVLCCGLFYSIKTLAPPTKHALDESGTIVAIMRQAFPASILPAGVPPQGLGAVQPGYALLLGLVLAATALRTGRRVVVIWLLPALLLLILIFPFPWLTLHVWQLLPVTARIVAGPWSIQRLAPPFAALATLAAAAGCQAWAERSRRFPGIAAPVLVLALAWSGWEAAKYVRHGSHTVLTPALSDSISRPENSQLLVNWLAFQPFPPSAVYQPGRHHDPFLLNRAWSQDQTRVLLDNRDFLLAQRKEFPPVSLTAHPLVPGIWRLLPYFMFHTGQRYLFELESTPQTVPGLFTMSALEFQHSETLAGGTGPSVVFPFWSSASDAQPMEMIFLPTETTKAGQLTEDFLRYRLIPYQPDVLPIRIKTLIPYRASLTVAEPALLETHRLFVEGYEARVNGRVTPALQSPDNRVMLLLPPGANEVQLDYVGPPLLRAGYRVMGLGWTCLAAFGLFYLARWWVRLPRVSPF